MRAHAYVEPVECHSFGSSIFSLGFGQQLFSRPRRSSRWSNDRGYRLWHAPEVRFWCAVDLGVLPAPHYRNGKAAKPSVNVYRDRAGVLFARLEEGGAS